MRTAAALAALGVGAILVGVVVGRPEIGIEGAYFTRASGTARFSSVIQRTGTTLFSPSDGNLWIGAGLSCCLLALVAVVLSIIARRASRGV